MPALKITLPCAPALFFEQIFVVAAESEEVCVAGDNDLVFVRKQMPRIGGDDFPNEPTIGALICAGSAWVKASALEKLPGRTGHDETMMSVRRAR